MQGKAILITGGAGYIGSHVVRQLGEAGERLVILDNLSTGFRSAVTHGTLVVGDTGDSNTVTNILRDFDVGTVIHFAAHTIVPESVADPLKYYGNNTCASRNLLACCARQGVTRLRVLVVGRRVWHACGGPRRRRQPDDTHQSLRHVEIDDRMDAEGPVRRDRIALRHLAVFQRGGSGPRRTHRSMHAKCDAADEGGVRSGSGQENACVGLRHRL